MEFFYLPSSQLRAVDTVTGEYGSAAVSVQVIPGKTSRGLYCDRSRSSMAVEFRLVLGILSTSSAQLQYCADILGECTHLLYTKPFFWYFKVVFFIQTSATKQKPSHRVVDNPTHFSVIQTGSTPCSQKASSLPCLNWPSRPNHVCPQGAMHGYAAPTESLLQFLCEYIYMYYTYICMYIHIYVCVCVHIGGHCVV